MIWVALIISTGALLYSAWCARVCERYARRAEHAADLAEASAENARRSLRKIKEL